MEPPFITFLVLIYIITVPLKTEYSRQLGSEKDVIVIDEFSTLDFYYFHTIEGLCQKFAKHDSSRHPWGGHHVILLGDPAQLPAVYGTDIFGTCGTSSRCSSYEKSSVLQIPP